MRGSRLAAAAVSLGACGGVAFALLASSAAGAPDAPTAEQVAAFGVLRAPAVATVPAVLRDGQAEASVASRFAPSTQLTRSVTTKADGSTWYVTPGRNSICFYSVAQSQGACQDLDQAKRTGLLVWALPHDAKAGAQAVYGLLPDDVTAATAVGATGPRAAAIDHNVVQVTGGGITALTLTRSDGTVSQVQLGG